MTYDKFIDDGEGLIIHPPPKDEVTKEDEDLEKYNHCHGYRGRFCSGGGGGAGGGGGGGTESVEGENYPMIHEYLGPDYDAEAYLDEHYWYGVEVEGAKVLTNVINDPDVMPDERAVMLARRADQIAVAGKVRGLDNRVVIDANLTEAFAQCEIEYQGDKVFSKLRISANPEMAKAFLETIAADKEAISRGELPWTASSHAKTISGAYKSTLVHEIGHAKLAEYTYSHAESTWAVPGEPHQGTKAWATTVKNAHKRGWEGPSKYAKTDLGEMFSESLEMLTTKSTTGDKAVDDYVKGVWARDTSKR